MGQFSMHNMVVFGSEFDANQQGRLKTIEGDGLLVINSRARCHYDQHLNLVVAGQCVCCEEDEEDRRPRYARPLFVASKGITARLNARFGRFHVGLVRISVFLFQAIRLGFSVRYHFGGIVICLALGH